ncbi:MAG: hypothetical protein KF696_02115 [Planctomycetes bacterium]|nr:hypothetical protein [Planctomycetota bacterium]MCW8134796.1 hypothetical protein [Planctomycetota bacterium]
MSDFIIIPAIELRGGLGLRYESVGMGTRASRVDPVSLAKEYIDAGAPMLHLYNLDGPFIVSAVEHSGSVLAGAERNLTVVGELAQTFKTPLQLSGGVRDFDSFKVITQMGVKRACFGSAAMRDPAMVKQAVAHNADAVVVFIDTKDGVPVSQDWIPDAKVSAAQLAGALREAGVKSFIYQDIGAEAAGAGPRAADAATIGGAILGSGVTTLEHIRKCAATKGLAGVIVGKPLAMKTFTYKQALDAAKEGLAARK